MDRKPLGKKGMKSILNLPKKKQKEVLETRKQVEEIRHLREKRDKQNERKRKKLQKELRIINRKYKGLDRFISQASSESELQALKAMKKEIDDEYKKIYTQLARLR